MTMLQCRSCFTPTFEAYPDPETGKPLCRWCASAKGVPVTPNPWARLAEQEEARDAKG